MGKDLTVLSVCIMLFVKMYDKRSIGISALIEWDILASMWKYYFSKIYFEAKRLVKMYNYKQFKTIGI